MADTELQNKLNSALRYGATTAGTAMTIAAVLSVLKPEQVVELKAQIEVLNGSILTAYGALTKMWLILGPIAVFWMGKVGWDSSTVQALAGKLLKIASNDKAPEQTQAKVAIVNIASDKAVVGEDGGVVSRSLAPLAATSSNVVSDPSLLTKS